MPDPVTKWLGWRKPTAGGTWQQVPGAEGTTRGQAYGRLMELSELTGGDGGPWQYQILPEGQRPAPEGPSGLKYRNRAMWTSRQ